MSLAELSLSSIADQKKKKKGCEQTFAELLIRCYVELTPVLRHLLFPLYRFPDIL